MTIDNQNMGRFLVSNGRLLFNEANPNSQQPFSPTDVSASSTPDGVRRSDESSARQLRSTHASRLYAEPAANRNSRFFRIVLTPEQKSRMGINADELIAIDYIETEHVPQGYGSHNISLTEEQYQTIYDTTGIDPNRLMIYWKQPLPSRAACNNSDVVNRTIAHCDFWSVPTRA